MIIERELPNIRVLDEDFQDIFILDTFSSFLWTDRYRGYGDFEIETSPSPRHLEYLKKGCYLWSQHSEHSMIIEDVGIVTDIEQGNKLRVSGRSLEVILRFFIVWDRTVLQGPVHAAIFRLLNDAIMNPHIAARRISNFVYTPITDPEIIALMLDETQVAERGDRVYDRIYNICATHNLGYKIVLTYDNQLIFTLYKGEDRSYAQDPDKNPYVVFSPNNENLINSNYHSSMRDYYNIAFMRGATQTTVVGNAIGIKRREIYRDVGISTSVANLTIQGREFLDQHGISINFDGELRNTDGRTYDADFFLGDIVQVVNEFDIGAPARLTEVILSIDQEGRKFTPTFAAMDVN